MSLKTMWHLFRPDTLLEVIFDFGFVFVGIIIAVMWVKNGLPVDYGLVAAYAAILALVMLAINAWLGFYQRIHDRTIEDSRARAVLALHLSIPVAYLIFLILPSVNGDRTLFELSGMAALFGMLSYRVMASHRRQHALVTHRILIFGAGKEAETVAASLSKEDQTVRVVGFYPGHPSEEVMVPQEMLIPREKNLVDAVSELKVDEIVVAIGERRGGRMPLRELLDCRLSGVLVLDMSSHFERMLGQIRLDALRAGWLIFGDGFRQGPVRTVVKRIFDIVAATILLILFSPLMLLTALAIMIEDGFPILYRQERVGLSGRLFNVIKFRSMKKDAEKDGTPRWASKNDTRVTKVGRIIRKLRIDELPQLFSVLKGDMSMVGPRPERAYFVDQLTKEIPFYAVRHSVKPGVTGWAQVRYQYGASVDDAAQKLQYDLYYVKNHSLLLDLVILFETVGVVVGGKGAQ
ncbi:TIGR03013 family XrtA/PEP-CTERM system glycosyltransferase [Sulfuricystis multivorans]|uniref:TIGR03013 family XrtA/PEP-CTERM system glycosyltransferase n=1 Tax=Sulfuricystis multivorans TaxID=2211108 RepID=UPI0024DF9343|nr:TIGR03013 family XrtA/PEP-CTERM system glycosyltransferase [Sulfuricystis multivorans]